MGGWNGERGKNKPITWRQLLLISVSLAIMRGFVGTSFCLPAAKLSVIHYGVKTSMMEKRKRDMRHGAGRLGDTFLSGSVCKQHAWAFITCWHVACMPHVAATFTAVFSPAANASTWLCCLYTTSVALFSCHFMPHPSSLPLPAHMPTQTSPLTTCSF